MDQNVGEGVRFVVHLSFEKDDPVQEVRFEVACARNKQLKLDVRVRASGALALIEGLPTRLDDTFRLLTGGRRTALPRQGPRSTCTP